MKDSILIVENEKFALKNLVHIMKKEGYDTTGTSSGPQALKLLHKQEFDLVLTDLKMERVDGFEVLRKSKELYPDTEVIIITAYATISSAVETMKHGAYYYISKPFKINEVRKMVKEALEKVMLKRENARLREQIENFSGKIKIITQDAGMKSLIDTTVQIGPTDCNVIISGESGTGKELFARHIHECSRRAEGSFFAINCGAFTEALLTSELFGYEKGAFTGASGKKSGLIEMASGGTLFLDEITETETSMQVKLLRVIQEKEILRLGATKPTKVDVRFIAATNQNPKDAVEAGRFREDLFFRLNVVSLQIPPLSERRDDIPLLSYHFLEKLSTIMNKKIREISPDVMSILTSYDFPGNVRELENIIERGLALANGDMIEVAHLPEDLRNLSIRTFRKSGGKISSLEDQEVAYINWVLKEVGGNKTLAAQHLGIDRVSLWRKLKKYGLEENA